MMQMTLIDLNKPRSHKIKSHYGVADYYKFFKNRYNYSIDDSTYRRILKNVNNKVRDEIAGRPYDFKIPKRLGVLKVRKFIKTIRIDENGKVKHRYAPDWKKTLELWEKDPQARKDKIRIYHDNEHSQGYTYTILYEKRTANYKNKSLYRFKANRDMTRKLAKNITNEEIDAFLMY